MLGVKKVLLARFQIINRDNELGFLDLLNQFLLSEDFAREAQCWSSVEWLDRSQSRVFWRFSVKSRFGVYDKVA